MTIRATLRDNTLLLTADNDGRSEMAYALSKSDNDGSMLVSDELHEQWELIDPDTIGALTDAPILAECDGIERDDGGEIIKVGKVAWFPDYMVRSPWEELRNRGRTVFTLAD